MPDAIRSLIYFGLLCLSLAGCGRSPEATFYGAGDPGGYAMFAAQDRAPFMAYTHSVVVDLDEDRMDGAYQAVIEACYSSEEIACEVMHSSLSQGDYRNASVTMRIEPEGVQAMIELATTHGAITHRQTSAEDLEEAITDLDSRISMLTTTRDKLLELEQSQANDIDSLIKITTELTRVQADLERLTGQVTHQRRRVETDVLSIQFVAQQSRSFWKPIAVSLSDFGHTLSEGIGDSIIAIAYLLPWTVLLLILAFIVRFMWRRSRGRR